MRASARAQRGQTIVIALLVLLLLAFVGGLFATIVTRNLVSAGRSNRVQSADYYAEAGIRFANDQLTASLDGADWRPPLQYQLDAPYQPKDPRGTARYTAAVTSQSLGPVPTNDPDAAYLKQGFTRYNIGGGRYLLRVTYDPVGFNNQDNSGTTPAAYSDPRARYIKIEAVGREGTVDSKDPTTYNNASRTQLNATLVQYKAIGITDYARFETNPENRSDVMSFGVSSTHDTTSGGNGGILTPGVFDFNGSTTNLGQYPITTVYGASDAYLQDPTTKQLLPNQNAGTNATNGVNGGGSIRVNGSVRFYGENQFYLNHTGDNSGTFNDTVEVAGNLLLDNYTPGAAANTELTTGQDAAVILSPATGTPAATDYVAPSNDKYSFDTHGGAFRDGNGGNDAKGQPRSVNRLDPPTLDTVNPVTNLPRYASITKNSQNRTVFGTAITAKNAGAYGYGQSLYVNNANDVQRESSSLVGGYTLIDEWLHRAGAGDAAGSKSGWVANFYRPPGVDIVLGRQIDGAGKSFYGVRLTRSDTDGAGNPIQWKAPTNVNGDPGYVDDDWTTHADAGTSMTIPYDDFNASNDLTAPTVNTSNPNNDVIIYAQGNVRVHGIVSADPKDTETNNLRYTDADNKLPRHVTIVTGGTAYIDGNLLRGNPDSSITVLAHDYVCVNTTQFLAGPIIDQNPNGTNPPGAYVGDPNLRALDFSASDEELIQEFNFGLVSNATAGSGTPLGRYPNLALYVSGGPSSPGSASADFDLVDPRTGLNINGVQPFTPPVLPPDRVDSTGTGGAPLLRTTFDLTTTNANQILNSVQSQSYQLQIRRTPLAFDANGNFDATVTQDFLLERAAILPMDIRIEAVLFAQTRSFFVIPGDWFNSSSDDNVQAYLAASAALRPGIEVANPNENRFPFFGQPIDMKIIIDGSVSEARPADITAQSAWMAKWGWIPQYHGGLVAGAPTTENSGHPAVDPATKNTLNQPGIGLQIIYNPLAGFPYTDHYLRTDLFGRPLPYAPKLPVCAGLLYAGQNTGELVLQ